MAEDVKIREGGSWEFIELLRNEELRSNTGSCFSCFILVAVSDGKKSQLWS